MAHHLKSIARRTWIGLIGVVLSIVVAVAVTTIWGEFGWRVTAAVLMILAFCALVGVEEFFRPPNPYTRVHPMFGYLDLGPTGELQGSDWSLIWMGLPLVVGAAVLVLSIWLF